MMGMMGMLPMIGQMVGAPSAGIGFVIHLAISAFIGITFAGLLGSWAVNRGSGLKYGMLYGAIWWVLGPLTLMPLMMGMSASWTIDAAIQAAPSLMGHLIYGGLLGVVYAQLAVPKHADTPITAH